ncbi:hypothetical protein J2Z48_000681 [Croceifilum oryzae]|uniref:Lipoprotein n=1 Tax=Croceifilum oryzae TaxID=1553429 RepID=A0AAJ1TDR4_9BACL|nr:hypothetical protein [Croceifilum oryzae]MDQ0416514.1 hypothetical protein [Croceifilum oryzae]
MKKKLFILFLVMSMISIIVGCNSTNELVIYQERQVNDAMSEKKQITDKGKIDRINQYIGLINWKSSTPARTKPENFQLWFSKEKSTDVPKEKKYYIWFNDNWEAEITLDTKYGLLPHKESLELKQLLQ